MRVPSTSIPLSVLGWAFGAVGGCYDSNPPITSGRARLSETQTCDELLTRIQDDAVAKAELEAELVLTGGYYAGGVGGPVAPPQVDPDASSGGSAPETPSAYSETNRQVAGVDEADIVKTDGEHLYVLHGRELLLVDSWPPAALDLVRAYAVEGDPIEMFVHEGRAILFSTVYDDGTIEGPVSCNDFYRRGPVPAPEPAFDVGAGDSACYQTFLKITVLDLQTGAVEREDYIEGYYTTSRRHGDVVRAVVQSNLRVPEEVPLLYDALWGDGASVPESEAVLEQRLSQWMIEATRAIRQTDLDDWLPVRYTRSGSSVIPMARRCDAFYVPDSGMAEYGLTELVAFDVRDPAPAAGASILGQASEVYANDDVLLLSHNDWSWGSRGEGNDQTLMHRFELGAGDTSMIYSGSGFVPGRVLDQFSLDERDGTIRVATTVTVLVNSPDPDHPWFLSPTTTVNRVSTLETRDDGRLAALGRTPDLAVGERIYSARFVGDTAYVVTFRQIDPLFVVDVSDPENLDVLGSLEIPGFSEYMHPMGPDHLLTIGRDVDEITGMDRGLALQIFDVSNPADPARAHHFLVGRDVYSEANRDHKAFNYYPEYGLLAFPIVNYGAGFDRFSSTLEVFRVDLASGFTRLGSVDHSALLAEGCYEPAEERWACEYAPQVRRGVFIEDFVYSISYGGIRVHDVDDLEHAVSEVPLDPPFESGGVP